MLYELYSFQKPDDRMKTDRADQGNTEADSTEMDGMEMDWMRRTRTNAGRLDQDRTAANPVDQDRTDDGRMQTVWADMDRTDLKWPDVQPARAGMKYMNEELVRTIQDCEASCEHMSHYIKRLPDFEKRFRQAVLLRDCADVCALTAKALSRHSMAGMDAAVMCARVCQACGEECARFKDQMSQSCSRICLHCARACAAYAGMQL